MLVLVLGPEPVAALGKAVEKAVDRRMVDFAAFIVGNEVLLADIGDVAGLRIFGEQVVEGLVLGRPQCLVNGFVPFLAVGEFRIDVEDHATEVEQPVLDDLADAEAGGGDRFAVVG